MHAGWSRWAIIFFIMTSLGGCSSQAGKAPPAIAVPLDIPDVTGVWQGRSIADCWMVTLTNPGRCSAMQKITLTMFQDGQRVTGSYRCSFGNENCRGLAETGVIRSGEMHHRLLRIRVMLDDGSMCFFTGMPQKDTLNGRYECQWEGPREEGSFHAERSY
jgi:hypothetical protein